MLVLPLNDRHDRSGFDCGNANLNSCPPIGVVNQGAARAEDGVLTACFFDLFSLTKNNIKQQLNLTTGIRHHKIIPRH